MLKILPNCFEEFPKIFTHYATCYSIPIVLCLHYAPKLAGTDPEINQLQGGWLAQILR